MSAHVNSAYSLTTRSSLLARLQQGDDEESWREFALLYRSFVRGLARSAGMNEHQAEEVLQDVLLSVWRNIGGFSYNPEVCRFRTWLTHVVQSRVADQHKKSGPPGRFVPLEETSDDGEETALPFADRSDERFQDQWEAEWRQLLLESALALCKSRVSEKDYQIFYLAVVQQLPAAAVCARLNLNRGQVYLAKYRVKPLVQDALRQLQKRGL